METVTGTVTMSCAAEARAVVRPPDMAPKEWGYYKAAIGFRCLAEQARARQAAAEKKLENAEETIALAKAIVAAPPPPAEGWSDLEMGVGIGLALVLGAVAATVGAWAATR